MKSQQISYPYLISNNEGKITLPNETGKNIKYLQIGIEDPYIKAKSLKKYSKSNNTGEEYSASIAINDKKYVINQNDVLEFSGLDSRELTIEILNKTNPYIIVDLAYDTY